MRLVRCVPDPSPEVPLALASPDDQRLPTARRACRLRRDEAAEHRRNSAMAHRKNALPGGIAGVELRQALGDREAGAIGAQRGRQIVLGG